MERRLLDSRAHRILLWAAAVGLAAACGKSASKNGSRAPSSDAGEDGGGQAGAFGSGGASGTSTGGRSAAGESPGGAGSGAGRGGAPVAGRGGSPAAGASSGGTSGAGGADSVAIPDGCTLTTHLLGGLFCSMDMTCESERVLISCQEDAGDWRCGCVRGDVRPDFYYFPDATGMRTCEVSALACLHPELLDADEICTLTDDATSSYSCTATDTCTRRNQVEGVTLEMRSEWSASCENCGMYPHACCRCEEGGLPDYTLAESEISEGCLYLDELCRGSGEITPAGEPECATSSEESMPNQFCHVAMTCQYPSELADGTPLTLAGAPETSCSKVEGTSLGDVTLCTCSGGDGRHGLSVVYESPGLFLSNCIDTNRACAGQVPFEPVGAEVCTDYNVPNSEMDTYCLLERRCFQRGTILGTEVRTVTGSNLSCELRDDGGWSCFCYEGQGNIELDAAADPESACAEAIERCPLVPKAVF